MKDIIEDDTFDYYKYCAFKYLKKENDTLVKEKSVYRILFFSEKNASNHKNVITI